MIVRLALLAIFLLNTPFLFGQVILSDEETCAYRSLLEKYKKEDAIKTITEAEALMKMSLAATRAGQTEQAKEYLVRITDQVELNNSPIYFQALIYRYFGSDDMIDIDLVRQDISNKLGGNHELLSVLDLAAADKRFLRRQSIKIDSIVPPLISNIKNKKTYRRIISILLQDISKDYSDNAKVKQSLKAADQFMAFVKTHYPDCAEEINTAFVTKGRRFLDSGDLDSSEYFLKMAYSRSNEMHPDNIKSNAMTAINLGDVVDQKGYFLKANKYLKDAESIAKRDSGVAKSLLPIIYNNIGGNFKDMGNTHKAIEYYRKSILYSEKASPGNSINKLAAYNNIGSQFYELKEFEIAESYKGKALDIAIEMLGDDHRFTAIILMSLGSIQFEKKDYDACKKFFDRSLKIRKKLYRDGHSSLANIYTNYAHLYRERKMYNEANFYIDLAIKNYKTHLGNKNTSLARAFLKKATINYLNDDYERAFIGLEDAKVALDYKGDFKNCSDPILYLDIADNAAIFRLENFLNNKKGDLKSIVNDFERVMQIFDYHISLAERISDVSEFATNYTNLFDQYTRALILLAEKETSQDFLLKAYQINNKGKNLGLYKSLNQRNQLIFSDVPVSLRDELSVLKGQIKSVDQKLAKEGLENQKKETFLLDSLEILQNRLSLLNESIKNDYPAFNNYNSTVSEFDLTLMIPESGSDLAIIDYRLLDSLFIAFILYDGKIEVTTKTLPNDFANQLKDLLMGIQNKNRGIDENISNLNVLVQPILKLPDQINQLVIIPDEYLATIPFETLTLASELLIQKYAISYANSASILQLQRSKVPTGQKNSFAGFSPDYLESVDTSESKYYADLVRSGNWALPFAKEEVKYISDLLGGNLFVGEAATKEQLIGSLKNSQILHLSMHAEADDDSPMNSRFIFDTNLDDSPENLLLYELYNLQANANMVVLSACETGKGSFHTGEGVRSLGNGFLYTGVPSVVMSLWKVPDESTSKIMISFYEYLKSGASKSEALRLAKLDYLNSVVAPEQKHPYYWAGFILTGNDDPIELKTRMGFKKVAMLTLGALLFMGILMFFKVPRKS